MYNKDGDNMKNRKELNQKEVEQLLLILKTRFENNNNFFPKVDWENIQKKLENSKNKLWILNEMEKTGGEPSLVEFDLENNEYVFYDCSKESPINRRNMCYDNEALKSRKANKPENNVIDFAKDLGIEILTEKQYYKLQKMGSFDLKTSSWIQTPNEVRTLGGALFCDRRYNKVFTYHNGAESYYSSRGFRGCVKI